MPENPGWFFEKTPFDKGTSLGVKIVRKVIEQRSLFQNIEIYDTVDLGRMLVLDAVIQLTEFDEFSYHEMFIHVPMMSHPNPKSVLVVGGGDGGMVRELVKYPNLERIDMCEIDGGVVELSKQYLPFTSSGLSDPRVTVCIEDGAKFIGEHKGEYDLILVDSSDPIGPAEVLYKRAFYEGVKGALKSGGAALCQCETIFLFLPLIKTFVDSLDGLFARLQYMNTLVPTYPSGMIGQLVCSLGPDFSAPIRELPDGIARTLRYYTPEVHKAAFHLPRFAARELNLR
jgi:spermidine synthase